MYKYFISLDEKKNTQNILEFTCNYMYMYLTK